MTDKSLEAEIERRRLAGCERVTFDELQRRIEALGYKLDRSMDCRSMARDMATGDSFPCVSGYPREADTQRSFCNIEARRDANFRALQEIRGNVFAVVRGAIYDA